MGRFDSKGLCIERLGVCLVVLALGACDAGPSAVMHDGEGKAASSPTAVAEKTPVWADSRAGTSQGEAEASMPVIDGAPPVNEDHSRAPGYGAPLKLARGESAVVTDDHYGDWPLWSRNRKYSPDDNAHYQFEKHGPEFGAKSYDAYVAMVHGFIHMPPPGTETIKRVNGDTLFYDPRQNAFAVMTKQGAPRTLFRPDDGPAYWDKQKQIEAAKWASRRGGDESE